ncbi:MAG: ZIP family metal transporter [Thioalkalivibrionaceae bacterium]
MRRSLGRVTLAAVAALLALAIVLYVIHVSWPQVAPHIEGLSPVQIGVLASLIAGLFTVVGALPIFFMKISRGIEDSLMGFGAGVMLAATAFELVLPAVGIAERDYGGPLAAVAILSVGILLGGGAILLLHRVTPHEHFVLGCQSCAHPEKFQRVWLFIFAIALHNLPEGLAVGVGFGGENIADGMALAIGIGLQNVPEGLIVAVALVSLGYSRWLAAGITLLTGLVQPIGGLIGALAVSLAEFLLPWGLAFAAGAMLFVISHEIIPESHRKGHEGKATFGVLVGFVVMLAIDVLLD